MVAEAALLRHGPAIGLPCLHLLSRAGTAAALHLLNNRLASFAGRKLLPTSMLPLPTTAILVLMDGFNAPTAQKLRATG